MSTSTSDADDNMTTLAAGNGDAGRNAAAETPQGGLEVHEVRTGRDGTGTTLTGPFRFKPDGTLMLSTREQTALQQALDAGIGSKPLASHLLAHVIGPAMHVDPEPPLCGAQPGDLYLICSDGLHNGLADERIATAVGSCRHALELENACRESISLAMASGGRNTVAVALVQFGC